MDAGQTDKEQPKVDMREINKGVISEFRANEGKLSGPMEGAPILLLTTTGRSTGERYTTPVGFIDSGKGLAVAAANGGSDDDPDWYRNIENDNQVTIEVPGALIPSVARIASGVERSQLLNQLSETLPGMPEHIAATTREIPVIVLAEAT